ERVAKIEGAIDGLKSSVDALRWVVTILAALIIGGFAFLGVQMTQANNRIAGVEGEVRALPDKINSNLLNLTKTLSDAITAAKQQPPQIILVPVPPQQQGK